MLESSEFGGLLATLVLFILKNAFAMRVHSFAAKCTCLTTPEKEQSYSACHSPS